MHEQKLLEKQTQQQHAGGGNTKSNGRVMLSAQQPLPHLAQSGVGLLCPALQRTHSRAPRALARTSWRYVRSLLVQLR
jgi:hypothetical protein